MKGFVYILQDKTSGKFYIGSTNDIERRLYQHNHGHTITTKRMRKIILIFHQEFPSLEIARRIERKLKRLKRRDYIEKIISDGFIKLGL
ncbi:hypothetical protein A3G50_02475 [Candidatus Jorgensenbacteria bacterium RIFCSPLOWO2_12_FULL_42_11]|uniref:GIY-YIG domain-containing protein n=1 Tax=Candidatus Jorgensenbacteria bacterium RIFCSPLOWO2_12_FULL_42_11 TaxID=1798473 RepID=A0A1F6C2J2_9BACT|nr:MAG: hypothetical protein A3G50_02475 [Candidatus Jorgensenbacteria bacterium RIFCSPLOWO2_12_FULL_42_11]